MATIKSMEKITIMVKGDYKASEDEWSLYLLLHGDTNNLENDLNE